MKVSFTVLLSGFLVYYGAYEAEASLDLEYDYVTVRPNAHLFYMLYHSIDKGDKPLIVWLQGGPGVSATAFGNFEEIGPHDSDLKPRNHTWVKNNNVLFIDSPVGTGFSYVESNDAYCTNNSQVVQDLLVFMRIFLQENPKFMKTPTYILAESYGGTIGVEFANLWYQEQLSSAEWITLRGIGLIDSLISPKDAYKSMGPYLYNLGFIDSNDLQQFDIASKEFNQISEEGDWQEARQSALHIESLLRKLTFGVDYYKVTSKVGLNFNPINYSQRLKNVMASLKNSFNLKSDWGYQEMWVKIALRNEVRKSVVHQVEKLLNETSLRVFVMNGQLDLIVTTPGTLSWIEKLNWPYRKLWFQAPRKPLVIDNIIEGYSKSYGNLKFYSVYRSGHEIPIHNPVAMEYILRDLIYVL